MKKVIMAAAVLCLGLLLGAGCGTEEKNVIPSTSNGETEESATAFPFNGDTEEDSRPSLSMAEKEEKLKDLAAFCKEHRDKLNEMSECFLDAVKDVSDYNNYREWLPDIDELAGAFTDEESREILEKLTPYYPLGYGGRVKMVFYNYEGGYENASFRVLYLKTDGKTQEEFLYLPYWEEVRKIDKYLFAVIEDWPCE